MHDRKLTECDKASGSGSPETPLKETADVEQHPAVHGASADADSVPGAVSPAPLPPQPDTASDISEAAEGTEQSADAGTAEPLQLIEFRPDDGLVPEAAAPAVSPDDQEAEPTVSTLAPANDPVTAPPEPDPEARQTEPPDIAPATQELGSSAGDPNLAPDEFFEPTVDPGGLAAYPLEPDVPQPEPHAEALQTADELAFDQEPELPSETAGELNTGTIELPAPPPSEPEAAPPPEGAQPEWNAAANPSASEHASVHAVPVPLPLQAIPAGPTPALEVPQARTDATDARVDRKPRGPFRLIATAVRYSVIALFGWLAAMVLLIAIFRFVNPPASALMLIRSAQGVEVDQRWVPLDEISPNLIRAVIASEDGRFCTHWGIDPREVLDAIRDANGGTPRGASTMTMQLAKNLFLWPQQSYVRKALEVPLTLAIDAMWPKSRIAEVYLNVIEWGPGIFGAEAAARRHFDTSAAKLSQRQSALLAVTLPNPNARRPAKPSRMHNRMASTIVARMRSMPSADDCVTEAR